MAIQAQGLPHCKYRPMACRRERPQVLFRVWGHGTHCGGCPSALAQLGSQAATRGGTQSDIATHLFTACLCCVYFHDSAMNDNVAIYGMDIYSDRSEASAIIEPQGLPEAWLAVPLIAYTAMGFFFIMP
jgi:hypothetical protein